MRALILSGGGFRGAVQLEPIKYLLERNKYDAVYGVSVGSINGILVAQDDLELLFKIWSTVKVSDFLKLTWWWPFKGLYSMAPLREKLETHTSLDQLKMPYYAGLVSLNSGEYYNLCSEDMLSDKELWDAVQASSCIVPMMKPPTISINGETHIGVDGGFRNVFPVPPAGKFDHLDIVSCTPLDRMQMSGRHLKLLNLLTYALRGIEILEDEVFDRDQNQLASSIGNGTATLYAPQKDPGPTFEIDKDLLDFRWKLGKEALNHPVHIEGSVCTS